MFITIPVTVFGVIVVLLLLNRRSVINIFQALRAQVGKLGRAAKTADPLAMLQQRVEEGIEDVQQAMNGLKKCAGLVQSLQRRVESGKNEKASLENRIKLVLSKSDPNNTANNYALQLVDVEKRLLEDTKQLEHHQVTYNSFAKRVETGKRLVQQARDEARTLGIQLEQSEREKEVSEFISSFSYSPDSLTNDLAEARELVQQKIDENRASSVVDNQMSSSGELSDSELVRQSEAEAVLAKFRG